MRYMNYKHIKAFVVDLKEVYSAVTEESTLNKAIFPNDDALRKMLYLASNNIVKKWTQLYREWDMVLNHLAEKHRCKKALK